MKRWQKLENAAIAQTARIMEETEHPLIRAIMEVIKNDSENHYRIQQLIIDSVEKQYINVFTDDLARCWESIERHIALEKKTIEMAAESMAALEGSKNVVQLYLLDYLKMDEEKHEKLLADLDRIKRAMYP
jgi:bacterioferritin (cytochrome b1)